MLKNMDQWDKALAVLAGAAFAYSCQRWLALGLGGLPGLALELAGIGLGIGLLWRRERHGQEVRRHLTAEMKTRDRQHAGELQRLRAEGRSELEAFRSTLSHSLRMPIAIIQGYAELLSGNMVEDQEVRQSYLDKIVQRSREMSDIVSRQLSSAGPADQVALSCTELDLIELVRQAAADMQAAAKEQQVSIQVLSQWENLTVEMDAFLLNRALFNLLENALKYMGRPGSVTIRVLEREAGGDVSVVVQDDGMGLPEEEAERVFEKNYQGSNRGGGQGQGLYLVKRAVEAHGGTASAQSGLGRGMRVALTLPRRQSAPPVPAAQAESA